MIGSLKGVVRIRGAAEKEEEITPLETGRLTATESADILKTNSSSCFDGVFWSIRLNPEKKYECESDGNFFKFIWTKFSLSSFEITI